MPKKYSNPRPKGEDLRMVFDVLERDTGCYAVQSVRPEGVDGLSIRTIVYRQLLGSEVRVAEDYRVWRPGGTDLDYLLLGALHRVYWDAFELAARID